MIQIGERIRKIRELRNYTQDYMAKSLNITQAGYSKIESGDTDVTFSKIEEIAKILNVSIDELVTFDQQKIFNNVSNVEGDNNGITIIEMSKEVKKLYEDKIALLEKLLFDREHRLKQYEERYGDL